MATPRKRRRDDRDEAEDAQEKEEDVPLGSTKGDADTQPS